MKKICDNKCVPEARERKEGGRKIGKLSESGAVCISEIGENRAGLRGAHQKQGFHVL